jgi:hypothetical protein
MVRNCCIVLMVALGLISMGCNNQSSPKPEPGAVLKEGPKSLESGTHRPPPPPPPRQ